MKKSAAWVAMLLSGSVATGATFVPEVPADAGKALVYVYRPHAAVNCCVAPYIYINGEKRGHLKNGGYLVFTVAPGPLTVEAVNERVGFKSMKLTGEARAGEFLYFRWSVGAALIDDFGSGAKNGSRATDSAANGQGGAQVATDRDVVRLVSGYSYTTLFTVEHDRELRLVPPEVALSEMKQSRKLQ